jgi:pimeloyl-ACP methyl ester carboxylesterase
MAEFTFDKYKVYYEVHGTHGKPLLVLNGIMMSTASWAPFIKDFSKDNILILVDFIDQGKSVRVNFDYDHSLQVKLLDELLKVLPYKKVVVMGISYGGEVALQFALDHPDKVSRLILANTAARTSDWLRKIGDGWNAVADTKNGFAYYLTTIPVIYSTGFFEERAQWMQNREQFLTEYFSREDVLSSLKRLTDSSRNYNVVDRLGEITCPTLIISGSEDGLLPKTEQQIIHNGIKHSIYVTINGSGHASMYENPSAFAALVLGYANLCDEGIQI